MRPISSLPTLSRRADQNASRVCCSLVGKTELYISFIDTATTSPVELVLSPSDGHFSDSADLTLGDRTVARITKELGIMSLPPCESSIVAFACSARLHCGADADIRPCPGSFDGGGAWGGSRAHERYMHRIRYHTAETEKLIVVDAESTPGVRRDRSRDAERIFTLAAGSSRFS